MVSPTPGIVVPGIPEPAAVIPGIQIAVAIVIMAVTVTPVPGISKIPGLIIPGVIMPGTIIPGIVPTAPGTVIPVIIPIPGGTGVHNGKKGGVVAETHLGTGRHHQGVSFTEKIYWGLFALS